MVDKVANGSKMIGNAITIGTAIAKGIAGLNKSLSDVEFKAKLLKLKEQSLDQREVLNGLREFTIKLGEKITELEGKLKLKEKVEFKDPFFYKRDDPNPLCPHCYQDKVNPVYLIKKSWGAYWGGFQCPVCKEKYENSKN